MNIAELFRERAEENWARKIIKNPVSYRLASWFLLYNRGNSLRATREMTSLGMEQTARAFSNRSKVAWTTAFFPSEILHAADIVPFAPEIAAGVAAAIDMAPDFLRRADDWEVDGESCSFHRCAVGASSADLFPDPDLMTASSHLCDGAPHLFRFLAGKEKIPFIGLDVPSKRGQAAEKYLASQLEEITRRLQIISGKKITAEDWEKTFHYANRTRDNMLRVKNLRKQIPSLLRGEEALSFVYLQFLSYGHPRAEKISKILVEELEQRMWEEEKHKSKNQKFRIVWLHLRPYYENDLFRLLEGELGARVVFEEMNNVYWEPLDPKYPYLSLARKILNHPGVGPVKRRIDEIEKLVREFSADAVIHFSHWGCRQSTGVLPYIRNELRDKEIPFLALDGDCVDRGSFPAGQIRTRVESFMEILSEQAG